MDWEWEAVGSASLLLVEDKVDMMQINQEYFQRAGYRVFCAETLAEARKQLERTSPDLIVLDIMLPDGSGLDFISVIRTVTRVPVIFVTCLNDNQDVIRGLEQGADDYLTKPYDLEVLHARIEALLRRAVPEKREIVIGELTLDVFACRAYIGREDAMLQPKEFALLHFLVRNQGTAFTSQELYDAVWGDANMPAAAVATVKSRIYHIRKKLRMEHTLDWAIESVGKGSYRFTGS